MGLEALVWLSRDVESGGGPSVGGEAYWVLCVHDHSVVFASPSYLRLMGRSPDHLYHVPTGWLASVHPEDRARVMMCLNAAESDGYYEASYRRLMVDGEVLWFEDRGFLFRDRKAGRSFISGTTRRC
jgi:PAS domain-containing protein